MANKYLKLVAMSAIPPIMAKMKVTLRFVFGLLFLLILTAYIHFQSSPSFGLTDCWFSTVSPFSNRNILHVSLVPFTKDLKLLGLGLALEGIGLGGRGICLT